jgi:hypothetical protein
MITKDIVAFGERLVIGCDKKCKKAFGLNGRPFVQLSEDENDIAWLSDSEVGIAPESGKTKIHDEGGDRKPQPDNPESFLNRWCYRECERCASAEAGKELTLKDFSQRQFNIPSKYIANQ